ncbi:spindle and kinetochore-associated protein 3 [Boleophthalmus pectinirostris]|uniref:spindle and kinetochore-associated protein 3 n=1 Tax=Boleophthalmus pectinirostris TaxID=150288 RepID=UPI00242AF305|nr:spindle and kinetochore-associated protein 3 [Boleophthalmus pectinirostris]
MDPTSQFFAKLRKLAITLETETTKLQSAFENRKSDDEDRSESTARGMRAYHELNCEVQNIKGQIQDNVAQQKTNVAEVDRFIKDSEVTQQKFSEDLNKIKAHWEKYGYQTPKQTENTNHASDHSPKDEAVIEDENQLSEEIEGHQQETEEELSPEKPPPPLANPMRTPQLSDFGLSEAQLKRALDGGEWCTDVPQMPEMNLPHPALNTPAPPAMALTPKRALCMDEEELLTPQMHDFGISEHTMCFNNDFTMDLRLKSFEKTKKQQQNLLEPPVNPLMESIQANDDLESPEPPVFCTPGLKIKKTHPTTECSSDLESPSSPAILPSTPEVPAFQTPYVNRLLSTKKNERRPETIKMESDDNSKVFNVPTPPRDGGEASKCSWEYNVPRLRIEDMMADEMPEMPNLESNLGNSLQTKSAKMQKKVCGREKPIVSALDLDGPTQEFNLGTPCVRRDYEEPSTPEMPDLSSVTQDICKLVSQTQMRKSANVVKKQQEKENTSPPRRFDTLASVSEQEFHSLPGYLRQMTLSSLNQAVDNINSSIAMCKGGKTEFHIEQLKQMINFGAKTPLFIVCLSELKRLDQIKGTRNNSVYKLKTHS